MKTLLLIISLLLVLPSNRGTYLDDSAVLGVLKSANMNSTADQAISIKSSKYVIRRIIVTNVSASLTLAVGGLYTASSKAGTAVVANTQLYSGLTASGKYLDLTLAAIVGTDVRTETTLYLSLTTAQGTAATADIFIIGDVLQ